MTVLLGQGRSVPTNNLITFAEGETEMAGQGKKGKNFAACDFMALRRRLLEMKERKRRELCDLARQKAADAAAVLKKRYGAREVYLYGSLAWGGFDEQSDIDLFAVGLLVTTGRLTLRCRGQATHFR